MTTAAPIKPVTHATHAEPAHGAGAHSAGVHQGVGHVVQPKILIHTALALLVLTVVTVAVAGVDLGEMNIYIALAVAVLKGSLVCLFFMHLRWDRPFNGIVFVISLALVALFIGFALTDSTEYQHEIIPGEGKAIQVQLDEMIQSAEKAAPHE